MCVCVAEVEKEPGQSLFDSACVPDLGELLNDYHQQQPKSPSVATPAQGSNYLQEGKYNIYRVLYSVGVTSTAVQC